jgi:hypothetical protein
MSDGVMRIVRHTVTLTRRTSYTIDAPALIASLSQVHYLTQCITPLITELHIHERTAQKPMMHLTNSSIHSAHKTVEGRRTCCCSDVAGCANQQLARSGALSWLYGSLCGIHSSRCWDHVLHAASRHRHTSRHTQPDFCNSGASSVQTFRCIQVKPCQCTPE